MFNDIDPVEQKMKPIKIFFIIAVILLQPSLVLSIPRIIHVEWEYQNTDNVAGYRLYQNNNLACATEDPNATAMDCTVEAEDGESQFTLTSYFQNNTESPPSDPFSYIFSETLKATLVTDILEGVTPLPVLFDASSSSGNIISYEWIFGDGEIGTGSSISHTFTSAGIYTVTLRVTDDLGATDQESVSILVNSQSAPNNQPTAAISSSASVGIAPFDVHFDGSGSNDIDGTIISYKWDMGDGGTAAGPQVTHSYTTGGTFHATLSVTDDGGLVDSISTPVIVNQPSEENIPPEAVISASTSQGFAPLSVTFYADGSSDPDGTIFSYTWNFGDGTTASGMSVNHIYTQPAIYTATLNVTDDMDASTLASLTIEVQSSVPEPSIVIEFGEISINDNWTRVDLVKQFANPVVVAGPVSYNDFDPAVIRIKNVDATGFEIRIQEWDYLDDTHAYETIHYIVIEQGNYLLTNGTKIEAKSFSANTRFLAEEFTLPFEVKPIVLTTITSFNEEDAVTGRIRKLSTNGFEFRLSEQESTKNSKHAAETINYIAWEPGSGNIGPLQYEVGQTDNSVTDHWYQIDFQTQFIQSPLFFAGMQTYNSRENSTVRYQYLTTNDVQVSIEEETSKDSETVHAPESVGYMVFETY